MAEQPETSGASKEGEAIGAPDEHGTSGGEKRHRKAGDPLCPACRKWRNDYDREYSRLRRMNPDSRAKQAQVFANWQRRNREHRNAYARKRARELRKRAEADRVRRIDGVVVQRLRAGEPVPHNRAERLEAVRQLRGRNTSHVEIAERLHVDPRQVYRDLVDLGLVHQRGAVA